MGESALDARDRESEAAEFDMCTGMGVGIEFWFVGVEIRGVGAALIRAGSA